MSSQAAWSRHSGCMSLFIAVACSRGGAGRMKNPFKRRERRNYTNQINAALDAAAQGKEAVAIGASAAVEAVSGLLARTLIGAEVIAPSWARRAISPTWLATVARELVRSGEHLSLLRMGGDGMLRINPSAHWDWRGGPDEAEWRALVSVYGADGTETRNAGRDECFFVQWARMSVEPDRGRSPLAWRVWRPRLQPRSSIPWVMKRRGRWRVLFPLPERPRR